jgi:hypothetical protein
MLSSHYLTVCLNPLLGWTGRTQTPLLIPGGEVLGQALHMEEYQGGLFTLDWVSLAHGLGWNIAQIL